MLRGSILGPLEMKQCSSLPALWNWLGLGERLKKEVTTR
jgi:hypothetical protein